MIDKSNVEPMWCADNGDGTYTNPILYTDYSDPDVIRVGEDYYMVSSSFANTPAVPLLHSKDLVNWELINYIIDKLPFKHYDEKVLHGCGVWAPAIRYHDGVFYVFIPFPDEGIMVSKSVDPFGKWSEPWFIKRAAGWIDPCPFWDDDGKAYMVNAFARSRIGFNSMLIISQMEPDCSKVLDDGKFVFDGHATQPTIEGPKLYKRNGYYYIFAPAGGVEEGWQTVLRSKNIYGPYEERVVLAQGESKVNGPHQGAWVDTVTGEDWFIHFQDVGVAGRITHLQPMRWEDDWPIIGVNDIEGHGEPVKTLKKPDVGRDYSSLSVGDTDWFDDGKLGLQWQWNGNYDEKWYSLDYGYLTLFAQPKPMDMKLCDVPSLLLMKWPAPAFAATARVQLQDLKSGDVAGITMQGEHYSALCVVQRDGKYFLQQRTGNAVYYPAYTASYFGSKETVEQGTELKVTFGEIVPANQGSAVFLRMTVRPDKKVIYSYSLNDVTYEQVGVTVEAIRGRWVGAKSGLFAVHEGDGPEGRFLCDWFVYTK